MDSGNVPLLNAPAVSNNTFKCICAAVLMGTIGCAIGFSLSPSSLIVQGVNGVRVLPLKAPVVGQLSKEQFAFTSTGKAEANGAGIAIYSTGKQDNQFPPYVVTLVSAVATAFAVYCFKVRNALSKAAEPLTVDWPVPQNALFAASGEKTVEFYGPNRKLFLGPLNDTPPAYLKGELPGDYGYDVMGLAENPKRLEQYRQGEIINGRWAMLGVVGMLAPELLAKFAGVQFSEPVWFKSGAEVFNGDGINYLGNPSLVHAQSITAILVSELLLIGAVEAFRAGGGPLGPAPADPVYPGKLFDPLGLANDPAAFAELKVKEVKNGRLAMMAFLGFVMQGFATGKGPVENWTDHLADPANANIIAYHQQLLSQMGGVAML